MELKSAEKYLVQVYMSTKNDSYREVLAVALAALREKQSRGTPQSPHPDGDLGILACPTCSSGEYFHNEDGNRNRYCGQCGQIIDWPDDERGAGK